MIFLRGRARFAFTQSCFLGLMRADVDGEGFRPVQVVMKCLSSAGGEDEFARGEAVWNMVALSPRKYLPSRGSRFLQPGRLDFDYFVRRRRTDAVLFPKL